MRPACARCFNAHALVATSAQALSTPATKRRVAHAANPSNAPMAAVDTTMPTRLDTHQRRQGEAQPARGQRAGQIAQIVAGRQPGASALWQRAVTHHQRQERREGEAADPHGDRQSDAGNGASRCDGERGQPCVNVEIGSHAAQ